MHLQRVQRGQRTSNNPGSRDVLNDQSIRKTAADYLASRITVTMSTWPPHSFPPLVDFEYMNERPNQCLA